MEHITLTAVALFVLAYAAVSGKINRTIFTPPMLFAAFGLCMGDAGLGLVHLEVENPVIHFIAEMTLVLVLFTDASRINLNHLKREHNIPVRLLALGLPMCMVVGSLAAWLMFPSLGPWQAAVLGIMLAPTDAALGQAVVSDEQVPERIRQGLNVESGLNDGIALPILFFFICLAMTYGEEGQDNFLAVISAQLILGPIVGILVGYLGGKLIGWGRESGWMNQEFANLSALGLALLSFAGAEWVGGNGFIASFCGGMILGNTARPICNRIYEFAESEVRLLTLLTFLFFGAVMLPRAFHSFTPIVLLYAVLSLTVLRILPVWISLLGLRLRKSTILFVGWFGPRGVASILYGLLLLEETSMGMGEEIFNMMVVVVSLSILAHGMTARPFVKAYGKGIAAFEEAPEHREIKV